MNLPSYGVIPSNLTKMWCRPARRFRGKRAYFRRLRARAAAFQCDESILRCDGLWHDHADWRGWGNLSWKIRRQHLEVLVAMYESIAKWLEGAPHEFQVCIYLDTLDAGGDATYAYFPTSERPRPVVYDDYDWDQPGLVSFFEELMPGRTVRVGAGMHASDCEDEPDFFTRYVVYCPGVGAPFES